MTNGKETSLVPPWPVIRWKVLERDGHKCTKCGSADNLHAHHKIQRRLGGTEDLDNLITLCSSCHKITEMEIDGETVTTLSKAVPNQASLRTVIPMEAIKLFGLKEGDRLEWEWHENDDTIIIRKAKKK